VPLVVVAIVRPFMEFLGHGDPHGHFRVGEGWGQVKGIIAFKHAHPDCGGVLK